VAWLSVRSALFAPRLIPDRFEADAAWPAGQNRLALFNPGADIPITLASVSTREDFSYLRTASMRWIDRPRHERG
jgi:hypothetical protein